MATDLAIAPHLRLALDDPSLPVMHAAAEALAALAAAGPQEALVADLADCCPATGERLRRGSCGSSCRYVAVAVAVAVGRQ